MKNRERNGMRWLQAALPAMLGALVLLAAQPAAAQSCCNDGWNWLAGCCGQAGQRVCSTAWPSQCGSSCYPGYHYDAASARCQPECASRDDGNCFTLGPCGRAGERACALIPSCEAPYGYDAASARCQDFSTCPGDWQPGRNDGHCFTIGPCGAAGQRACADAPSCIAPAAYDAASALCQLPPTQCLPPASVPPRGSAPLDVTFYVASDLHFGVGAVTNASHARHVRVMNQFPSLGWTWPANFYGAGQPMGEPVGLVTTGDLTHYGHPWQIGDYRLSYEKDMSPASIRYPVFVGLGNHDLDGNCWNNRCARGSLDYARARMKNCNGVTNFDDGSGNYSWDWNSLHLVQLNKWAGDTVLGRIDDPPYTPIETHPSGLEWLKEDLRTNVGNSGRPVVLFQHFGFDGFSSESRWFPPEYQEQFAQAIAGYNVIGIFTGHTHDTYRTTWRDYDNFSTGDGGEFGDGDFLVVRVTQSFMSVAGLHWSTGTGDTPSFLTNNSVNYSKAISVP